MGLARVGAKERGKGLGEEPMAVIHEDVIMKSTTFYIKLKS